MPSKQKTFESFWYCIFRDTKWLDYVVKEDGHPGLMGPSLNDGPTIRYQYLILIIHDGWRIRSQESQRRFFTSLRCYSPATDSSHEITVGNVRLNLRILFDESLYTPHLQNLLFVDKPSTEYTFWTDESRVVRKAYVKDTKLQTGGCSCSLELPFTAGGEKTHEILLYLPPAL